MARCIHGYDGFCPRCFDSNPLNQAGAWERTYQQTSAQQGALVRQWEREIAGQMAQANQAIQQAYNEQLYGAAAQNQVRANYVSREEYEALREKVIRLEALLDKVCVEHEDCAASLLAHACKKK